LTSAPAIVAGDFNNHPTWDKPGRLNTHANTVEAMTGLGLISAYHAFHKVDSGKGKEPTLYWRNRTKEDPRYHIDYCFVPKSWTGLLRQVTVGSFDPWIKLSDHMPLIVDLESPERNFASLFRPNTYDLSPASKANRQALPEIGP